MQALRQGGVGQFLMAAMVFAIIAVFLLEFRTAARVDTGSLQRECAAKVGKTCISQRDYGAEFGLVVPRSVSAKQVKALGLRKHVLDGIVERELLADDARRLGLGVDEDAAKAELRLGRAHVSLPAARSLQLGTMLDLVAVDESGVVRDGVRELPVIDPKTQEVDDDLYARVVRSTTNRSPKEFLKMQQRELLAARVRDLVRARVRISEAEAFDQFQQSAARAVARTVRLDPGWFERWAVDLGDAAVDAWSAAHAAEVDAAWKTRAASFVAGCPLASEIRYSLSEGASEAQKTLAKERADAALAALAGGRPFARLARAESQADTAAAGGELGCVNKEALGDAAEALAKALEGAAEGAVVGPIETKLGFHLLRAGGALAAIDVESRGRRIVARSLAARALGAEATSRAARELINAVKGGRRLDDTLAALVPELAALAIAEESPEPSAKEKPEERDARVAATAPLRDARAPRFEVSSPFGLDGSPVPGVLGGPPLGKLAFDLEVDGVHPEPITVLGATLVLQLKEKTVPTREEFDQKKAELLRELLVARRAEALTAYVARLRKERAAEIQISASVLEEPRAADAE